MFGKIKIRKSDQYFSKYIRSKAGWKCEHCHKQFEEGAQFLQCSHFYGRRNEATRYSSENCSALCFLCHRRFTENPEDHRAWMLSKLGEKRFKKLMVAANSYQKKDEKMAILYTKKLLEEYVHSK